MSESRDLTAHYQLKQVLGWSGSARTFRGEDPETGKAVAVKLISLSRVPGAETLLQRFATTVGVLRSLSHPSLPEILDHGSSPAGDAFLVSAWIDGLPLPSTGPMDAAHLLPVVAQLAEALESLSLHGLVHLNLRPDNVLVEPDGHARLVGWGSSLLTVDWQSTAARPADTSLSDFGAPELQGSASSADALWRADAYSLALMTSRLLGTQLEGEGTENPRVRFAKDLSQQLKSAEILREMLQLCLDGRPEKRPDSYSAILRALQHAMPRDVRRQPEDTQPVDRDKTRAAVAANPFLQEEAQPEIDPSSAPSLGVTAPPAAESLSDLGSEMPTQVVVRDLLAEVLDDEVDADTTGDGPESTEGLSESAGSQKSAVSHGGASLDGSTAVSAVDDGAAEDHAAEDSKQSSATNQEAEESATSGDESRPAPSFVARDLSEGPPPAAAEESASMAGTPSTSVTSSTTGVPSISDVPVTETIPQPILTATGELASVRSSGDELPSPGELATPDPSPSEPSGLSKPSETKGPVVPPPPPLPTSTAPASSPASPASSETSPVTSSGDATQGLGQTRVDAVGARAPVPSQASTESSAETAISETLEAEPTTADVDGAGPPPESPPGPASPVTSGDPSPALAWLSEHRILVGIAAAVLFGFVLLVALVAFWWRGGSDDAPQLVQTESDQPSAPVEPELELPDQAPVELPPELLEALDHVATGRWLEAREALEGLGQLEDEGSLPPEVCEAFRATEELVRLARRDQILGQLAADQGRARVANLSRTLGRMNREEERLVRAADGGASLLASSRRWVSEAEDFERLLEGGSAVEALENANRLASEIPRLAASLDARNRAVASLDEKIDLLMEADRLEEAQRMLGELDRLWPDRPRTVRRRQLIAQRLESQDRYSTLLARIEDLGARRPHEGLAMLSEVTPPEAFAARFDQLRDTLEIRFQDLDQGDPTIELARPLSELEYKKGEPITVELVTSDDYEVASVRVNARLGADGVVRELEVQRTAKDRYTVVISPSEHDGKPIELWASVVDLSGHRGNLASPQNPERMKRKPWFRRIG